MRKFNLSLDDYAPHERAGLHHESIKWCNKLIDIYPEIKINLFVPAAYCRLKESPCYISKHPEWVKHVNELPKNYQINLHGMFHRRVDEKNPDSNNDEFQFLKKDAAVITIDKMLQEFDKAKLKYEKVFRAPGWKLSQEAAEILSNRGFVIAGNEQYYRLYKDKVDKLKWVSYNWDLKKECIIEDGDIVAYGHTSAWTDNFFNEEKFEFVKKCLEEDKFEFVFIQDFIKEK